MLSFNLDLQIHEEGTFICPNLQFQKGGGKVR